MPDPPLTNDEAMHDDPPPSDDSYMDANTCVFWDVVDYPIPNGSDPVSMGKKIKSAMVGANYRGEVSIKAYVDADTLSDELRGKYCEAGITVSNIPEGDAYARISPLLVDAFAWALTNPAPANMIVLAKNLHSEAVAEFQCICRVGFGIVLSEPSLDWLPPLEMTTSFLSSLFDNKRKREDTLTMAQGREKEEES